MRLPIASLALVALLTACASSGIERVTDSTQPHLIGEGTPVSVTWGDPAQFTELRYSQNRHEVSQGDWVAQLADHISERTARALPPGERVDVEILDVERAGEYEWAFGGWSQDVRVLRDVYPPRMVLRFRRLDADGRTIEEGERRLADLGYLMGPQPLGSSDPLRYEKRMIDQWVQKEFVRKH